MQASEDKLSRYMQALFLQGVKRCSADKSLTGLLYPKPVKGKIIVLGAGKAAAEMAATTHKLLGSRCSGCVVTRYGHTTNKNTGDIKVIEAGHPVPDDNSARAAKTIMELASSAGADDRVVFLISGGGSALLSAPIEGVTAQEKVGLTKHLLDSGAPITDINFIRKHISAVKGGRLAHIAAPASCETYIISDVVGDNPKDVASGPTLPMVFDSKKTISLLRQYGYKVSDGLQNAVETATAITVAPHKTHVIATGHDALDAVETTLTTDGWTTIDMGDSLTGDAARTGFDHAKTLIKFEQKPGRYALISGGELTVKVNNPDGKGGANLEYLTGLMTALKEGHTYAALACDSDGIDGSENNAGGWITGDTYAKATAAGLDPHDTLADNLTYALFKTLNQLIITGPTRTNVNDIRIILTGKDFSHGTFSLPLSNNQETNSEC